MKIRNIDKLQSYSNAPFEAVKLENERLMLSEEMRVLYVALTRAKEKLIMTMTSEDLGREISSLLPALRQEQKLPYYPVRCAKSFGQWLLLGLLRHPDAEAFWQLAETKQKFILPCASGINLTIAQPPEREASEEDQAFFLHSRLTVCFFKNKKSKQSASMNMKRKPDCHPNLLLRNWWHPNQNMQGLCCQPPNFYRKKSCPVLKKGTAVHTFLQFADFVSAAQNLPDELRRMVELKIFNANAGRAIELSKLESFFPF